MNKKDKPSQLELFSSSAEIPQNAKERTTIFDNRVSFNIEHLLVLCVVVLMFIVFSFSLGVEKGKKIAIISGVSNIPATEKRFETIEKRVGKEPQANQLKTDSFKRLLSLS